MITVTPAGGSPVTLILWVVSPSKFVAIDGSNVGGVATNVDTAVFVFRK